ncbi:MAG TPA: magnesium/cobalt transporter CorA [Chitinophagaceae bacterium]|jgi:magnesium transporter
MTSPAKYFNLILPFFNPGRTKQIFDVNPIIPKRTEATEVIISAYDYTAEQLKEYRLTNVTESFAFKENNRNTWINIDGIRKADVETICNYYGVHYLLIEDILSVSQRPKMDEVEGVIYCLLNMLYFNEKEEAVESEQVSIILGNKFALSFQENNQKDVFNPIREKLRIASTKLRQSNTDYLCYSMIDVIVDNYYTVLEKLGEKIEQLEEEIIKYGNTHSLASINRLRKELIVLKRNIGPVRDMVNAFLRSESELLEERTIKYFKDVYDHIVQANDLVENYRDMIMSLQDLYMSRVNLRLNEVMKVMAIVTCLLAPATVIGGIFGMNFEVIPLTHQQTGFYIAVGLMLFIPLWMIWIFKRRGWF